MKRNASRQYTIRNIPDNVDRVLRQRARESGKSFNQVAVDALVAGAGEPLRPKRDLSGIAGSMTDAEADLVDQEIRLQHRVDEKLWQ